MVRIGITRGQFTEVPTPTIVMKRVAEMDLAENRMKAWFFENSTGATVNDLLPDDKSNEAFNELDGNITGVEYEAETEIQEPETYIPQINNNQYAALVGEEENEGNANKSTGVDNGGEITGVRHDEKITGVDSDNESSESGSMVSTDEADELALIEEVITEA